MPDYELINEDKLAQVESAKTEAIDKSNATYDSMIGQSDKFYQDQINASKEWADTQTQLQKEQTDFAIEQIEQQKDKAHKDYVKEQSGAYVDWQKQSNQYGVEAERQAAAGMDGTGFSESSQVSMYNTYQNRVATAREVYSQAVLNYDNAIKDARLQNNAVLAEIAHNALKEQLELSLQGFQYKNQLVLDKANKEIELDNAYWNRYLGVLDQLNTQNALAEEIRQFNLQYEEDVRQFNKSYDLQLKEYNESIRQFNEEIARLKKKDEQEYKIQIQELELKKKAAEEEKRQWEAEMKLERDKLAETKRQFNAKNAGGGGGSSGGGSGGSGGSSGGSGGSDKVNKGGSSSGSGGSGNATPTNNMDSILALGYGPISASRLASLMESGQVTRTLKNGQWYYSKNTSSSSYNRMKNMGLSN